MGTKTNETGTRTTDTKSAMHSHPATQRERDEEAANADAITGAPGSHPVGTGIGAAAAGAAGAAIGSVVPGVGTVVGGAIGAVVGAVAGGYAGKAVAEMIDPTDEDAYWREEYSNRDYHDEALDYDRDYAPAYRMAADKYNLQPGARWEESQKDLQANWSKQNSSRLDWDRAQLAMRDVYERDRVTGEGTRRTGTSGTTVSNPD